MKYTGWAVLIIGVLIGAYGLVSSMSPAPLTPPSEAAAAPQQMPVSFGTILLGFSALAMAAGIAMLVLGGRGTIKTKNLAVRN